MVEAAFCGLKKLRKKGYQIDSCDLYGGEPLLKENMATVRAICEHAQAVPDAVLDDLPILDRQVFPLFSGMIASFPPGGGTCWIVMVAVGAGRRHERRDGWRMPRRRERRRRDTREGRSRIASIGFDVRFDRAGRGPHLQSERACAPSSCETKRNDVASPNSIEEFYHWANANSFGNDAWRHDEQVALQSFTSIALCYRRRFEPIRP